MNAEKLAQAITLLAQVRAVLDGGYHYSSPALRTRGHVLREKPDALALLVDVVVDLDWITTDLKQLDSEAKVLQIDTNAMCGVDLPLYTKVYERLASEVSVAVHNAVQQLQEKNESKPERRRVTRAPKASNGSSASQTSLLGSEPPNAAEVQDGSSETTTSLE